MLFYSLGTFIPIYWYYYIRIEDCCFVVQSNGLRWVWEEFLISDPSIISTLQVVGRLLNPGSGKILPCITVPMELIWRKKCSNAPYMFSNFAYSSILVGKSRVKLSISFIMYLRRNPFPIETEKLLNTDILLEDNNHTSLNKVYCPSPQLVYTM